MRFVKVNCNKTNKELGIALGIKVAPTFHLYRNSTKVHRAGRGRTGCSRPSAPQQMCGAALGFFDKSTSWLLVCCLPYGAAPSQTVGVELRAFVEALGAPVAAVGLQLCD